MKTITLSEALSKTAVQDTLKNFVGVDNSGATGLMTPERLAAVVGGKLPSLCEGVFIMFHRKSDDFPLIVKPHKWTSYQTSGEVAEGVVVVEGGKMLVVAPSETRLTWSSAPVSGGGTTTTDRLTAFDDWNGKANTAAQVKHPECNTNAHAPGFCNAYSRTNANGKGLTAGKWWLPSMGELMCMYANMTKINYALKLITGATPLAEDWYWSSTERSATNAWNFDLNLGYVNDWGTKTTDRGRVRPVSAFII